MLFLITEAIPAKNWTKALEIAESPFAGVLALARPMIFVFRQRYPCISKHGDCLGPLSQLSRRSPQATRPKSSTPDAHADFNTGKRWHWFSLGVPNPQD